MRTTPHTSIGIGLISAVLCGIVAGSASALASQPLLPDLVPARPEHVHFETETVASDPLPHLSLRFDGVIHNAGPGVLELHGRDPVGVFGGEVTMSRTFQRAYFGTAPTGGHVDIKHVRSPTIYYATTDDHDHFHLRDATRYELVSMDGDLRVPFTKHNAGFCFVDTEAVEGLGPPYYPAQASSYCQAGNPEADSVMMGLSVGWQDRYGATLTGQSIDASFVSPGEYRLLETPDPEDVIVEANEANNKPQAAVQYPITVPGYLAKDLYSRTSLGVPAAVQLRATKYTSDVPGADPPGPVEFAVLEGPSHGRLVGLEGAWSRVSTVLYVPDPGYVGPDTFVYGARDEDHPNFPRTPSSATAKVMVGKLPAAPSSSD